MLSASAFGSVDNTYLDLDYSGYHKNLIQQLFTNARVPYCIQARSPQDNARRRASRQKVSNSRETKVLTDLLVTRTDSPIFENQFGD